MPATRDIIRAINEWVWRPQTQYRRCTHA